MTQKSNMFIALCLSAMISYPLHAQETLNNAADAVADIAVTEVKDAAKDAVNTATEGANAAADAVEDTVNKVVDAATGAAEGTAVESTAPAGADASNETAPAATDGAAAPSEATSDATATSETPAATEASATGEAATADGTAAQQNAPKEIIIGEFNDWTVRCIEGTKNCIMVQRGKDANSNEVIEMSIIALPAGGKGKAGVTVATPIMTLLSNNLAARVDSGRTVSYPFQTCFPNECFVRFGLDANGLAAYKAGGNLNLRLFAFQAPDKPIDITVSLAGFTAAFNKLAEISAQ